MLCGFAPCDIPLGSIADMALKWNYSVKESGITLDSLKMCGEPIDTGAETRNFG